MTRAFKVPILLPADPTALLEAATKQYVDNLLWNTPRGCVAKGTLVTPSPVNVAAAAGTQVDLASLTATTVTNRRYKLTYVSRASNPKGCQFWLMQDGVQASSMSDPWMRVEGTWTETIITWIFDVPAVFTAASHTYTIRAVNNSGLACQFYHDANASYWILEDIGPTTTGSLPAPPTGYAVLDPAYAGPRGDDSTMARHSHQSAPTSSGWCASNTGLIQAIYQEGQQLGIWKRTNAGGWLQIAAFAEPIEFYANPKVKHASAALDICFRDNLARTFALYAQGDQAFFYDSQVGNMGYFTKLANNNYKFYCGGVFIGVHPAHGTYAGIWVSPSGGEAAGNYFMITADNGANVLVNAGSSMGFRIGNGTDCFAYNNSQVNSYRQFAVRASVGTNPWDQANIVCTSSMDMQRISFNSPGIGPQLRGNAAYGDHLECVNNPGSAYCNIRAAAFPIASSIAIKKDIRPIRVREILLPNHNPKMDKIPDLLDVMALRPVAFRPKTPAMMVVGEEEKESVERPLSDLRGHEGSRERIGLIAEEVEKVIPSAVDHYADGSMGAIDYAQITVALLDHVQRLTDEVSTLRYRIAELESK